MLFVAMPLSLRSDKRKRSQCHDGPLSKKIALHHQDVPKYRQTKTGLMSFTSSSGSGIDLSTSINEEAVSMKKTSSDAKISPQIGLCSDEDDGNVWSGNTTGAQQENGLSNLRVSEDEELLVVDADESSHAHDSVTPFQSPKSKLGPCKRGDFQVSSNGDVIPHAVKQPSLVLEGLNKMGERKKSGYDRTLAESADSSLIFGGYMRRMASLNASACVSALMEPEKRTRPNKNILGKPVSMVESHIREQAREPRKSWSLSSSEDLSPGVPSPIMELKHSRAGNFSLSPARYYESSSSSSSSPSSSEADTSKDSDDILGMSGAHEVYTLLALATLASAAGYDLDEIPYNTLGLLYNGDTIHPAARVFYTSDTDLTLPDRIIPTVVPSQANFVRPAISEALTQRLVGKKRKGAKVSCYDCLC